MTEMDHGWMGGERKKEWKEGRGFEGIVRVG